MRRKQLLDVGISRGLATLAKLLTSLSSGSLLRIVQLRGDGEYGACATAVSKHHPALPACTFGEALVVTPSTKHAN